MEIENKNTIFVGNLNSKIDEDTLRTIFESFGEIRNISFGYEIGKNDKKDKKDFAFIEYEDQDDCNHAIENMNNSEMFNRYIKVSFAKASSFNNYTIPVWMRHNNVN